MVYVALLRGINVGGKNKVSMPQLKTVFEKAGMKSVSTYINSGNVIFEGDKRSVAEIAALLENAIANAFGFSVKVLVWCGDSIVSLAEKLPDSWVNDTTMKCDVMFLWETIDTPDILKQLVIKPEIDDVRYHPGVLLWSVGRENVTKSGMMKLAGTKLYKQMTIRNCNTLRRLADIVSNI